MDMSLPPFPKKLHGPLFTEIIPTFVHEVNPRRLVELGAIVIKKGRKPIYDPLKDSLLKLQWVKLVGLKAIAIEKEMIDQLEPNTAIMNPLGQTAHALCITDCIVHTKSALDCMAVFLTDLLNLKVGGAHRDFKLGRFRQLVSKREPSLRVPIKNLTPWLDQLQKIRDEWIHRSTFNCSIIHGKSSVGLLPIPKNVMASEKEQSKFPVTEDYYLSTTKFVGAYYSNLLYLFNSIVDCSLRIERKDFKEKLDFPVDIEKQLTLFRTKTTEDMTLDKMKVKLSKSMTDW